MLIQRLNKQHGHVSSCCHKISHATSIKCTLRGRSEQNCFVKLTNVKRLLLLIVVHCKIICLALRRSALIIIYTATTCPSYDGLHDSLIYRRKCDLCTCTRYATPDKIWMCDLHITEHTAGSDGKPVQRLPDSQTLESKCYYCTTGSYTCPVGHTVYLCMMRHGPQVQNPYCPINPDDGKLA